MRKKVLSVLMIAVFLLTGMLSIPAFAAGETISIGSGDALLAVISATSGTAGNVYELTADVSVSTASLSPDTRTFEGEFKGNGHTITVTDATAQPLFGTIGDGAQVKNVTVAFQHNVLGATLANKVGSATIDGVTVTFAGDVLFASTSVGEQAFSYACGLFGTKTGTSNQPTYIKNVSIAGNGRIGSTTAVGGRGVCAAGVYAETSADGMNDAVLDHVTVTVGSIYAVTSADEYQAFCNAAGAVAGAYYGYKANCGYVTVNVTGNIHASATNDAGADVDAYGLAYTVQSLYSCQINVGGNIEAYGTGHDY